jgi:hypothetical protein
MTDLINIFNYQLLIYYNFEIYFYNRNNGRKTQRKTILCKIQE